MAAVDEEEEEDVAGTYAWKKRRQTSGLAFGRLPDSVSQTNGE